MNKLSVYKSERGLYLSRGDTYTPLPFAINGVKATYKSTWDQYWKLLEGVFEIKSVQRSKGKEVLRTYWKKGSSALPEGVKLPDEISQEDSKEWFCDSEYEHCMGSDCKEYLFRYAYSRVIEYGDEILEEDSFEINFLGEIETELEPKSGVIDYKIRTLTTELFSNKKVQEFNLNDVVTYSDLQKMLNPSLLNYLSPCTLSSQNVYKMVRAYVKENIDGRYATVTSDYDFCFTVKKVLPIKPWIETKPILKQNGRPYASPRFSKKVHENKTEVIFEMTHEKKGYQGYTIIQPFSADNLEEMVQQVEVFLKELIEVINKPVVECNHCKGSGHVLESKYCNER